MTVFLIKFHDWLWKCVNCGYSRSLHIIKHLSSSQHLVLFYRKLKMTMLNFVLLLLLIGVLTAPSFFNSKMKHKTTNFSPYSWSPELYYSFILTIIVSINWIGHLIYKSRYIWGDMKESFIQNFNPHWLILSVFSTSSIWSF